MDLTTQPVFRASDGTQKHLERFCKVAGVSGEGDEWSNNPELYQGYQFLIKSKSLSYFREKASNTNKILAVLGKTFCR